MIGADVRRIRTRTVGIGATLAVAAVLLAGCTGGGAGSSAGSGSAGGMAEARSGAAAATPDKMQSAGRSDRSVTTTGSLDLAAANPVRAAAAIDALVTGRGGRLQDRNDRPGSLASSNLTARIPASAFDSTLKGIEGKGTVVHVSVRSTDVTAQVTDYSVRTTNLRASIARLQALISKASTTTDLVEIESSLTTRQTDLERLLAQRKDLADQVSFATLAVSIVEPAAVPHPAPATFVSGFAGGLAGLVNTLGAIVVVTGVLLPWVVALGLLALAAVGVRRLVLARTRRRRTLPSA